MKFLQKPFCSQQVFLLIALPPQIQRTASMRQLAFQDLQLHYLSVEELVWPGFSKLRPGPRELATQRKNQPGGFGHRRPSVYHGICVE